MAVPPAMILKASAAPVRGAAATPSLVASELSDRAIVDEVLAGKTEHFEELVARYERPVYALLYRMVRRREDAEDLAQETFVKAFRQLDRFDRARAFRPWIYRIASNSAVSFLRRKRPAQSLDEDEGFREQLADGAVDSPRDLAAAGELESRVTAAIDQLAPTPRAILQMRFRDHMSLEEIGLALGKTSNAVAVSLHRARLDLREMLALGHHHEDGDETS